MTTGNGRTEFVRIGLLIKSMVIQLL